MGQATLLRASAVDLVFSASTPDRMSPRWLVASLLLRMAVAYRCKSAASSVRDRRVADQSTDE